MTNPYTFTHNAMEVAVAACNPDIADENLEYLKYAIDNFTGALLPVNALGSRSTNFTATLNQITTADITASITGSLPTSGFTSGVENIVVFDFSLIAGNTFTFPTGTNIKWNGKTPTSFFTTSTGNEQAARNRLIYRTLNGGTNWEAEYIPIGGVETAFTRPNLTANGTLGGASFAVASSSAYDVYYTYNAVDASGASTYWLTVVGGADTTPYITLYNPDALKIVTLTMTNPSADSNLVVIASAVLYGSNNNSDWTNLKTITNSNFTNSSTWTINVNSTSFYKYHKIQVALNGNAAGNTSATRTGTADIAFTSAYYIAA